MSNNTFDTVCSRCIESGGGCCVDVKFNVHESEAKPFLDLKKKGLLKEPHSFKEDKNDKGQYVYDSKEGRCIFLNEKNVCSIYEQRPLICRMYPVLWKSNKIYIDMICPLVHFIPLKTISSWHKKDINSKQMKHMEELDFDARSRQYVCIDTLKDMNEALEIVEQVELK